MSSLSAAEADQVPHDAHDPFRARSSRTGPPTTEAPVTLTPTDPEPTRADTFRLFAVDLYRDIHKGIRAELFSLTEEAGRIDPSDGIGRAAVGAHVRQTVDFLVQHAEHEDGGIQPALEAHLPDLAEQIADEHEVLEGRMDEPRRAGRCRRVSRRPGPRPERPPALPGALRLHLRLPRPPGRGGARGHAGARGRRRRGRRGGRQQRHHRRHPARRRWPAPWRSCSPR